ncbi:MAG: hypothetical protein BWY15_00062 [Firmicutes bacterium ADurb.Bin193]|nr:MAG: hypothetical protein BWY15_00062 [Firmicutes bacterium ADurb.Bin193]
MKTELKNKGFLYPIIATILVCVSITIYCIINGEPWTYPMMYDPLFFLQAGQIFSAIILAVILALIKPTRKNGLWFIIPLILIAFAFLYDIIVHIVYPCC